MSRPPRRALTMIEMLMATTISVSIMSAAFGLVHRIFRDEQAARRDFVFHHAAMRLSDAFRSDVRRARRCEPTVVAGETVGFCLTRTPADVVRYRTRDNIVERTRILEGGQTIADEFVFPACCSSRWIQHEAARDILSLIIVLHDPSFRTPAAVPQPGSAVDRELRIDAVLAADRRWEGEY